MVAGERIGALRRVRGGWEAIRARMARTGEPYTEAARHAAAAAENEEFGRSAAGPEPTRDRYDKPVLAAAIRYIEDHDFRLLPQAYDLAPQLGLEAEEVGKAERRRALVTSLAEHRRSAGLSQTEVAARMGTSQSAVARIESGAGDVRASTLERYAAAIGRSIDWRLQ